MEFQPMYRLVKSKETYKSPQAFPIKFSAFFWIIPLKTSSSVKPVVNIMIILAKNRFNMFKLGIKALGCNIRYSIKPRTRPLKPTPNCKGRLPRFSPTLLLLIFWLRIKKRQVTSTGKIVKANQ